MLNPLELNHAKHDEEIALLLHGMKKSIQWTTIICFYSALHYLRYKMFPLTEITGGVTTTYNSLDDYYSKLGINCGISMHECLVNLVWEKLPSIAPKYQILFHTSITARYNNYTYEPTAADSAVKHLTAIKKECISV